MFVSKATPGLRASPHRRCSKCGTGGDWRTGRARRSFTFSQASPAGQRFRPKGGGDLKFHDTAQRLVPLVYLVATLEDDPRRSGTVHNACALAAENICGGHANMANGHTYNVTGDGRSSSDNRPDHRSNRARGRGVQNFHGTARQVPSHAPSTSNRKKPEFTRQVTGRNWIETSLAGSAGKSGVRKNSSPSSGPRSYVPTSP